MSIAKWSLFGYMMQPLMKSS